jgi:hypothetical protein
MRNKNEAGQALILTAVALVALIGFAGLAIDMGVMRHDKRLQQTAADAAAIAGASNLGFGGVTSGAQDAASRVGYTDNGGGLVSNCAGAAVGTICVEVNNPPKTGPHASDSSPNCPPAPSCYVEALVAVVQPTYFMKVLSINSETITARAVASNLGGNGCLYTLGTPSSSIQGVNIVADGTLNASSCGIVDNGNYIAEEDSTVSADTFGVSGSLTDESGSVTCTKPGPCPTYGIPAASDPLSQLTPPCTSCSGGTTVNVRGAGIPACGPGCTFNNGTYTISPGTYCSISINGGAGDQVVFSPGVFSIVGSSAGCPTASLNITGDNTISGSGVTFYFTNSSTLNMTRTPTINLTAPDSSGTYPGILMFQDPNDTATAGPTLGGKSGSKYGGALYFPNDRLTFYGSANSIDVAVVVSNSIKLMSGSPTVNIRGSAGLPPGAANLIKSATLVE